MKRAEEIPFSFFVFCGGVEAVYYTEWSMSGAWVEQSILYKSGEMEWKWSGSGGKVLYMIGI